MTIEELQEILDRTPADTAMNRATRREILARIYVLMDAQEKQ